jgi:hypothetical protein
MQLHCLKKQNKLLNQICELLISICYKIKEALIVIDKSFFLTQFSLAVFYYAFFVFCFNSYFFTMIDYLIIGSGLAGIGFLK